MMSKNNKLKNFKHNMQEILVLELEDFHGFVTVTKIKVANKKYNKSS